jgi:hypothetical protein
MEVAMRWFRALTLSLPVFTGWPVLAPAQNQPAQPSEFISVITATARTDAIGDFVTFQKRIKAAGEKSGAPQRWTVSSTVLGGPGRTYTIVLPFNKWSEMDGWMTVAQMLTKAFGQAEGMKMLRAGIASMENSETAVYQLLPDLSSRPRALDPPPTFIQLFVTEVEPAMVPAYRSYLAKIKEAQEKSSRGRTAIRRVAVQGAGNTYVTAMPFNKFADRDNWPTNLELLQEAFGEAEARSLEETRLKSTRNLRLMVLEYRPDLSRPQSAARAATR